jgi:oligoribonuclease NrnB/cAMP/cGMP phosphodiesterase (DHH superfamily)
LKQAVFKTKAGEKFLSYNINCINVCFNLWKEEEEEEEERERERELAIIWDEDTNNNMRERAGEDLDP